MSRLQQGLKTRQTRFALALKVALLGGVVAFSSAVFAEGLLKEGITPATDASQIPASAKLRKDTVVAGISEPQGIFNPYFFVNGWDENVTNVIFSRLIDWDSHGNLVGINTAIYSRSGGSLGIGFAIPISTARSVMEQIIQTGAVTRGWIGVEAQEITPELAESFELKDASGALIAGVQRGSPADASGIRPGDILLSVEGKPVKDPQVMLDLIAALAPEERAAFRLRRDKTIVELQVRIGKRPAMRGERE